MKKNVFKLLGIICIVAMTALFVVACGPGAEPEPKATQNSDGSWTIEEGATAPAKPADPTKKDGVALTELSDMGLFKNFAGYEFDGWVDANGAPYDGWGQSATAAVKVVPKFKLKTGGSQVSLPGTDDVVYEAFNYLNTSGTADRFDLFINKDITPKGALTLAKTGVDLTITSDKEREIKSPDLSALAADSNARVFLIVGGSNQDTSIKLTLKNIGLVGSKVPTGDSLIRVRNGANLILENKSTVADHINSSGLTGSDVATTGNGRQGNGSAICVVDGGVLTIKSGANITDNTSTGNQSNTNLVGGIYVISTSSANKAKIVIEGGYIGNNTCTEGNTSDIYITEDVILSMKGNATIGELCLNADDGKNPDFTIEGKITNEISKLNLRSTGNLTVAKAAWAPTTGTKPAIFKGTTSYTITQDDVDQFKLWEFTGNTSLRGANADPTNTDTWANYIPATHKIQLNTSGATANTATLVLK